MMADDDDKGTLDRFGWTNASDIEYLDDDGNWVRGGEVPDHVKELLKQHEAKKVEASKTADARAKSSGKRPRVRVHIHRGRDA